MLIKILLPQKIRTLDFLGEAGRGSALDLSEPGMENQQKNHAQLQCKPDPLLPPPFSKTENGGGKIYEGPGVIL